MRLATVLLIGVAIAGVTGLAVAAAPKMHEMTVALPNGGTAHIRYTGNVAPKINFVQAPASPFASVAFGPAMFGAPSPFADFARVQAMMDRQMASMLYQADQMQRAVMASPLYSAALRGAPAGQNGTSFVSTLSGNAYCLRSVQITHSPNGGAPKVVSHTEGNCGGSASPQAPANMSSQTPSMRPLQTIAFHSRTSPHPHQGI